jgi:hypothetical protein
MDAPARHLEVDFAAGNETSGLNSRASRRTIHQKNIIMTKLKVTGILSISLE